ncbi:S53 family peptidase [Mucilaginibacter sp. X5P1]|uniref:S53 family peptidase n=1 Tax=Mucilaginibacter sp. X5P1 TaxID=2723088 RepID=UPI0016138818|nr:S53 family peptidase [Mucilaginibacter sp. X5P1]MBB6136787.1 kumamolisin [Mucilaginibacter sp. X5P1]
MENQPNTKLTGSFKPLKAGANLQDTNKDEVITVTVRLRRKKELPADAMKGNFLTRDKYESDYGASLEEAEQVEAYAHEYGLSTVSVNLARRSVHLTGTVSEFEKAFNTTVKNHNSFRVLQSEIQVPEALKDIIVGVFGLDNHPIARPMFQVAKSEGKIVSHAAAPQSFTPNQLAGIYGFPTGVTGKGQCIGIIELGGGYRTKDITAYFKEIGVTKPTVKAVSVDGGKNSPSNANGADGEVMLDIEVAGAVAPGATIVVYFAGNTDQGFLDAVTNAIHDTQNKPSVISISWGSAEVNWTQQAFDNFNEAFKTAAALGVTICVASGDSGSRDDQTDGKVHVDFPASSPYALACGGTKLVVNGTQIISETVWHESSDSAGGGGVSTYFPLPDYQANANVPLEFDTQFKGRGVPDVAGDADPDTGYKVRVDGQDMVIGGTSAVAPLMAGLIALINEKTGKPAGDIHAQIYANPGLLRDITSGDNKTTSANTGYTAGPGWDACTGLGVLSKLS